MYSAIDDPPWRGPGSPIQKSLDLSLFSGSPKLVAANHVFHRFLAPRHPPWALNSLAINYFLELFSCSAFTTFTLCNCQRTTSFTQEWKFENEKSSTRFSLLIFHSSLFLVEVNGIEPMTSCVQSRRSPNWATPPTRFPTCLVNHLYARYIGGPR